MSSKNKPLAERMRPTNLEQYVGQKQLVGEDKLIRRVIERGYCPSMIFWGPPGVGKTTLARLLSNHLDLPFYTLSAINAGVKQVREVISLAEKQQKVMLFIDEIHRFTKSQQDSLLGAVEKGIIILIGATTENPSFEVIPALLSRCQVYVLNELSKEELLHILNHAIYNDAILREWNIELQESEALLALSGGDARRLLNNFELLIQSHNPIPSTPSASKQIVITNALVEQFMQKQLLRYDKTGEQHYDIISAFIKSIRGSDPNAAVYWLVRMIEGGEDPKFIARRLLILASEDIGNANPTAMVLANNCFDAIHKIGYPECELILSQTTIYLAMSVKSNASYEALLKAKSLVKQTGNLAVPLHLRNAPTKLMKELGYGNKYKYAHAHEGNFVDQEFMPDQIKGTAFYKPSNNGREREHQQQIKERWGDKY